MKHQVKGNNIGETVRHFPNGVKYASNDSHNDKNMPRRVLATRAALLKGARIAFANQGGFAETTIAHIVAHSGSSMGSLYNQFGGKEEIYFAVHREYHDELWEISHAAIERARAQGVTEPLQLYLEGVDAYLHQCWELRDLANLFHWGDVPPSFDTVAKDVTQEWIEENETLLGLDELTHGEMLATAITATIGASVRWIAKCADSQEADKAAEYFTSLIARMLH